MTAIHPDIRSTGHPSDNAHHAEVTERDWAWLYRTGAVAALIAALLFRRNIGAEASLFSGQVAPSSAGDWFALLQTNRLLGLAFLNVFDLVNYGLVGLMYLGLYPALRRVHQSGMALALSLGLVGVGVYFASNQAFSMLALSTHYAAATTEAQQTIFLAAGEALLAINNPGVVYQGAGIYLSLLLVTLAGLLISGVMLRSGIFSRIAAYLGIVAHVLVLSAYVMLVVAPAWLFLPHTLAAIPLVVWEILIARKLLQLAHDAGPQAGRAH